MTTSAVVNMFLCIATSCTLYNLLLSYPGATISIQETEISIAEETSGQICIILEHTSDGLERDVLVSLTSTAGTASNYSRKSIKYGVKY